MCYWSAYVTRDRRMKPTSRRPDMGPSLERGGHGICDRAVASSFFLVGRFGVALCDHGDEMKVTFAMPGAATPAEVQAAYEASEAERELMTMARRGRRK